jgi:hypothetical protein
MPKIKIARTSNKRPKKLAETKEAVKPYNAGKVTKAKVVKPMNTKKNYGVKDSK